MKNVSLQLAQYNKIVDWQPQLGDIVVYHGWFTHWFGIINSIQGGVVSIVQAGLPILLLTLDELDIPKQTVQVGVSKIRSSRGGKYTIIQLNNNNQIWFI